MPAALAIGSLGPIVLVEPRNDILAYAPIGFDAHSTDYWYPPETFDSVMKLTRFNDQTLAVAATANVALMGAGFAGDRWTFTTDLVQLGEGPGGDEVLWFNDSDAVEPFRGPVRGLRVMPRRDATGAPTRDQVIAIGTGAPYTTVPFSIDRHRLVIASSWGNATVRLDGALVWSGDPGWTDLAGVYPILQLSDGNHRFSVVPRVEVSFLAGERAEPAAFRVAFAEAALGRQDAGGRFSRDNRTDAWTALALVLEHRRTGEAKIGDALDRWAEGRVVAAVSGHAWPGAAGTHSIRENVGEPGIALSLWANDRDRQDWAAVVREMIEAAGFSGCRGSGVDWCRLGNLQPDGEVIRGGEPGAAALLVDIQFAETAGFIAGADVSARRDWIRSLAQRTYPRLPCQTVEMLGAKGQSDQRPWSSGARAGHPTVMFLLGLAYSERPGDPIWSEPTVRRQLTCGLGLLQSQVGGPMGWRTHDLSMEMAIASQDVAAARLLFPLTGTVLERSRFEAAWERLVDPRTLRARAGPHEALWETDYRTAIAATMLAVNLP